MKQKFAIFLIFSSIIYTHFAGLSAQESVDFTNKIRLDVWSELDAMPGTREAGDMESKVSAYAVKKIKEIAPNIINRMVYGVHFEYTPSDKLRAVPEFFRVEKLGEIVEKDENGVGKITYHTPYIESEKLHCYIEYLKTATEVKLGKAWRSLRSKKLSGTGRGRLERGFDGLGDALDDALKGAVRSYFQKIIRNKPKSIEGDALINGEVLFGIKAGYYVVSIDFFLNNDIITVYKDY